MGYRFKKGMRIQQEGELSGGKLYRFRMVGSDGAFLGWVKRESREAAEMDMAPHIPDVRIEFHQEDQD